MTVTQSLTAPTTPGLHRLFLRFRDELGYWSNAETRLFYVHGTPTTPTQPLVTAAEYFFDNEPGPGAGQPLTMSAAAEPSLAGNLVTTGLTPGLHRLFLRYQDETGRWSTKEARLFYVQGTSTPPTQPQITAAEYFFDVDPGTGAGTPLTFTASDTPVIADTLATAALATGFHQFYLRVRDEAERWSNEEARLFYIYTATPPPTQPQITAAEYYFDVDPGPGEGHALPVTAEAEVSLGGEVDTTELGFGLHRFFLRVQDELGRWSTADCRLFYKHEPVEPTGWQTLAQAEYFINHDPGPGNGVAIELPVDGAWDDTSEAVDGLVENIPVGRHWIGLRYRDSWGSWSSTVADSFMVGPIVSIQPATLPATLTWEGDLEGDMIYIYRASNADGPFALIDSTLAAGYVDAENPAAPALRLYRITQKLDGPVSRFRLPYYDENGQVAEMPRKASFDALAQPVTQRAPASIRVQEPADAPQAQPRKAVGTEKQAKPESGGTRLR